MKIHKKYAPSFIRINDLENLGEFAIQNNLPGIPTELPGKFYAWRIYADAYGMGIFTQIDGVQDLPYSPDEILPVASVWNTHIIWGRTVESETERGAWVLYTKESLIDLIRKIRRNSHFEDVYAWHGGVDSERLTTRESMYEFFIVSAEIADRIIPGTGMTEMEYAFFTHQQ